MDLKYEFTSQDHSQHLELSQQEMTLTLDRTQELCRAEGSRLGCPRTNEQGTPNV